MKTLLKVKTLKMKKQGQVQLLSIKVNPVISALFLARMEELITTMEPSHRVYHYPVPNRVYSFYKNINIAGIYYNDLSINFIFNLYNNNDVLDKYRIMLLEELKSEDFMLFLYRNEDTHITVRSKRYMHEEIEPTKNNFILRTEVVDYLNSLTDELSTIYELKEITANDFIKKISDLRLD